MSSGFTLDELFEYTEWQRRQWFEWFRTNGDKALDIGSGSHGDGRFTRVGDLVRHIFSAEQRYLERIRNQPLTDTASIPADNFERLFAFGEMSRAGMKKFVASVSAADWETPLNLNILSFSVSASPRKIVLHVLMHEIRHWAQIATLLRLNGLAVEFHDFIASPVLGGGFKPEATR